MRGGEQAPGAARRDARAEVAARRAAAAARRAGSPAAAMPAPPWLDRPAGAEEVRACYRFILGRDPEDDSMLAHHLAEPVTVGALRERFLASEEFRGSPALDSGPPPEADLVAGPEELERLMLWQMRVWAALGEDAPQWSVMPEDDFRPDRFPANRRRFQASGAADAAALVATLARHGIAPEAVPRLLEHGCGTGRVTPWLAQHFPEITGMDVSSHHLALARQETQGRGLVHLRWLRARPGEPMPAEGYDLWYSRRTLQWNPPPLIRRILELAFAGLAPGGVAVFQVPTWYPGYRFSTASHLAGRQPAAPELHLIPQGEVFALAAAAGLRVLEVREDSHLPVPAPSALKSQLFVLRKPG
ncbi:class I SAM-dependent methyltransferase [Falsiroseomonas sp. CW058]|uniref:class I SAM-dependent methyltransferase n=1 Tax=Falsiroseomonas sp. CW058 TaxID=3388664 RepID=UPI003D317801